METQYFLGIDISKKKLDAALTIDGKNFYDTELENTAQSIESFFKGLNKKFNFSFSNLIVCVEHTGIYGQPLLNFSVRSGIKICQEPALQIKQSQGISRGKTDQVDARRIALYAFKNSEELIFWKPQRACIQKLKALLATRDQLVKQKTQLQAPLKEGEEFIDASIVKAMSKFYQKPLKALQAEILEVERAIDSLIKEDQSLSTQYRYATSVPGVGKITALYMILTTGEFSRIRQSKKFACYAGVAPFEHSSGSSIRGKTRVSKMANMTLKKLLHLAAMSAIRCCEELKAFYKRKTEQGKNKMSVLNAVRNKLISRVFACIKNERMYQKNYQHTLA